MRGSDRTLRKLPRINYREDSSSNDNNDADECDNSIQDNTLPVGGVLNDSNQRIPSPYDRTSAVAGVRLNVNLNETNISLDVGLNALISPPPIPTTPIYLHPPTIPSSLHTLPSTSVPTLPSSLHTLPSTSVPTLTSSLHTLP